MKTSRWFALLAMVVTTAFWACDSGNGSADAVTADTPTDVQQPPADVPEDPGLPLDPGTFDPGPGDPGAPDVVAVDNPPADVPPGCPAVVTGPTCHAIAACALQCTGAGRETECVGTADAAEVTKWQAVRDCLATAACAAVFENEQLSVCATTACPAALEGCFAATVGKCCAIVNCRKECDPDDPSCPLRCFGLASKDQQAVFVEYKDCILDTECAKTDLRANSWPTWTCEEYAQGHNCPTPTQECFPPSGCN